MFQSPRHFISSIVVFLGVLWISSACIARGQSVGDQSVLDRIPSTTPVRPAATPETFVGEALILPEPYGLRRRYVYLLVSISGKRGTLILDTGYPTTLLLSREVMTQLGMSVPSGNVLDSLSIGTTVLRNVLAYPRDAVVEGFQFDAPPGMPPVVGLMGNHLLSQYDLLFDGPAQRVRLYLPPLERVATPWLPPGITSADSIPIVHGGTASPELLYLTLPIRANGHAVQGLFDSGSDGTYMNLAMAKVLNIRQSSPHVHRVPDDSATTFGDAGPQKEWVMTTGLVIQVDGRQLVDGPVEIFQTVNEPNGDRTVPELNLGTDILRDRLFFISYDRDTVYLSPPIPRNGMR